MSKLVSVTIVVSMLGGVVTSGGFFFLFLFGTMTSVLRGLGFYGDIVSKNYFLLLLVLGMGALVCLLLFCVFRFIDRISHIKEGPQPVNPERVISPLFTATQFILSLSILVLVVRGINHPMDPDGADYSYYFSKGDKSYFDPRHTANHVIANLASYSSIQLFGLSNTSARLPSIVFSILYLIALGIFSRKFLSPFTSIVLLLHLTVNQLPLWYMHSMRGYISMMLLTLLVFALVLNLTQKRVPLKKKQLSLFALLFVLAPLTHMMAGIFCIFIFLALLLWLFLNRFDLAPSVLKSGGQLLLLCLMWMPVYTFLFAGNFLCLSNEGMVHGSRYAEGSNVRELLPLLGYFRVWWPKILLFVFSILLYTSFKKGELKLKSDFTALFLIVSGSLLFLSSQSVSAFISERFLLAFPIIFIFWICERAMQVNPSLLKNGLLGTLAFLFCGVPVLESKTVIFHQDRQDLYYFLKEVKGKTATVPTHCYSFSHSVVSWDKREAMVSETYYLGTKNELERLCHKRYFVNFEAFAVQKTLDPCKSADPHFTCTPLFSDGKGRFLAELIPMNGR